LLLLVRIAVTAGIPGKICYPEQGRGGG